MDELEKHIRDHREEMDVHNPDPGLWNRIEKDLPRRERRLTTMFLRVAAIVLIAVGGIVAIFAVLRTGEKMNDPYVTAAQETYYYYDSQIRVLYEEAEPLLTANPEVRSELTRGMSELDSLSAQIIRDLHDNIASQEVLEALIINYRLRIELIEDMLKIMTENEEGTEKTKGNEL